MADYSLEHIEDARRLHMDEGYSIRKTAQALNMTAYGTVAIWKKRYNWKKTAFDYPVVSLKAQLKRVTKLVDILEPELEKMDILNPTPKQKELLSNFRRLSELQLKLIKQLGVLQPLDRKPAKKNIFL